MQRTDRQTDTGRQTYTGRQIKGYIVQAGIVEVDKTTPTYHTHLPMSLDAEVEAAETVTAERVCPTLHGNGEMGMRHTQSV